MTMPRLTMPTGPQITPKTMSSPGVGGQANPPYLQMRTPTQAAPGAMPSAPQPSYPGQQTQPVITPKAALAQPQSATPGQAPAQQAPIAPNPFQSAATQYGQASAMQPITPSPAGQPAQAGGQTLGDVYNFFASDLANQTKQALANTRTDAAARGVYYGTPLTGSEADINTQYLRGLGQLQAGMYGNEQQNQLARLGLASNLGWQSGMGQPSMPSPVDWSSLGAIFGGMPSVPGGMGKPPVDKGAGTMITPRTGPTGTSGQSQGGNVPY